MALILGPCSPLVSVIRLSVRGSQLPPTDCSLSLTQPRWSHWTFHGSLTYYQTLAYSPHNGKEQDEGLEVSELLLQGSGVGYQEEKQRNMLGDRAALHAIIIPISRQIRGTSSRNPMIFDSS